MSASLRLTIASHHIKVEPFTENAKQACFGFTKRFIKLDIKGNERLMTVFATANTGRTWFRYHINSLNDFYMFFRNQNIPKEKMEIINRPFLPIDEVDIPIKKGWEPKDEQEPIIEYLTSAVTADTPKSKLVGIQTGGGKTFCAVYSISKLKHKVACVIKPKYIEKWIKDFKTLTDIDPKEIMVIQGSKALQDLTQMALTKGDLDPYKVFIFSNRSLDNFFRAYEKSSIELEQLGYLFGPDELFEKIGVGIRLVDEVHEEFHANFRLDLYTHVPLSISLSATLLSRDPVLTRMYEVAYPKDYRFNGGDLKKYADSYGVRYGINPNYKIRTSERGQSSYSHTAYEASIMKNDKFTDNYARMIKYYLDRGYVQNYEKGNKAIVFAATIALCTKLTEKLSNWYPDLTVKRFVAGDDYQENYQDPDIRVTTIGSGGTGHDIKGLTDAHMTNAIESIQANIQAFGRLRDLGEKETRFFFYSCDQIPKHHKYHFSKMKLMKERAKSFTNIQYENQL